MTDRIYFDNAATTPLDPRVAEAMLPWLGATCGNASSLHREGRAARDAVERARQQVADLIGAAPREIVFTASGTEADNLALRGPFEAGPGDHLVTSEIEHPAVLETCKALERRGISVTRLRPGEDGLVDAETLARAIRPMTRLVSVMAANNVVGTIQPIVSLGGVAHAMGVLFHTDAVQSIGKIPFDVRTLPVDLVSISAHKIHGPQGVGALWVRRGVGLTPVIHGGGQEMGRRSATENVAGIVGFGRAAEIARAEVAEPPVRLLRMRDRILDALTHPSVGGVCVGHRRRRLPGHAAIAFPGIAAGSVRIVQALDEAGVAVGAGSACGGRMAGQSSPVLRAMGLPSEVANSVLRVTLGRFSTEAEVERFLAIAPRVLASLRQAPVRDLASAALRRAVGA